MLCSSRRRHRAIARALTFGLLLLGVVWTSAAVAEERELDRGEPRLTLPGGYQVRPGESIELRWTRADAVSELEILVSYDGGQHYSEWISPELDPSRLSFTWRVPNIPVRDLRLRVRYNREGREVEGAPTARLTFDAGPRDAAQPLGLPDADRVPANRAGQGASTTEVSWALVSSYSPPARSRVASTACAWSSPARRHAHDTPPRIARGSSPRFVPLRT